MVLNSIRLRRFVDDERGSLSIELLVVVPILVWVFLSTFVYFDVFRTEANINRAALTVADMFSREQTAIDDNYIDGAVSLLRALTYMDLDPDLRVTVYNYDPVNTAYVRTWSESRGMGPPVNDFDLNIMDTAGRLPSLADGDFAILLETRTEYSAPVNIGFGPFGGANLEDVTFDTFTVIRPRYTPQRLCFDTTPGDDTTGEIC